MNSRRVAFRISPLLVVLFSGISLLPGTAGLAQQFCRPGGVAEPPGQPGIPPGTAGPTWKSRSGPQNHQVLVPRPASPRRPSALGRSRGDGGTAAPGGTVSPGTPGDSGGYPAPWVFCPGDIGDTVTDGVIDPSHRGFAMSLLGEGFILESMNLSEQGSCESGAPPSAGTLVLATSFRDESTRIPLSVTQTRSGEPRAALLESSAASFSFNGYDFAVSVGGWYAGFEDGRLVPPAPGVAPVPDDAWQGILQRAVTDLAPDLDLGCFYLRVCGTWDNLADIGIGDPRSALPPGFVESTFDLTFLKAPPAECNPVPHDGSASLSVGLVSESGPGSMTIWASSLAEGQPRIPGRLDGWGLSWSSNRFQFGIWGELEGRPLSGAALEAIAEALDPSFSADCLLVSRELREAELPSHGFRAAQPPDGFTLVSSQLHAELLPTTCSQDVSYRGSYSLWWSFQSERSLWIDASAYLDLSVVVPPAAPPEFTDTYFSWSDSRGVRYWFSGYSLAGGQSPTRTQLEAVARSMDSTLLLP